MEIVLFDKNGEPLKVRFIVKNGVLVASYLFELFDPDSNDAKVTFKGNNINPNDDCFLLPLPIINNDGRTVQLNTNFKGVDLNLSKSYSLGFELYQGEVLLDTILKSGALSQTEQSTLMMIKLKAK